MSLSVREAIAAHCNTAPLSGISNQVVRETLLLAPGALVPITLFGVTRSGTAHLFLQPGALLSLRAVLGQRPGHLLVINSALRPLPDQVAVHCWYLEKRCGITLAAPPGESPHERGVALDVQDPEGWRAAFHAHSWGWQGERDPMHYTFLGDQRHDIGAIGVRAFQVLHNRHAAHRLAEDGAAGPLTIAAVLAAPAGGFPE